VQSAHGVESGGVRSYYDVMQLLLAEDDDILADGLTTQLTLAGFEVEHAPNGPVAEYLLAKKKFDAVILDLGLPMVDGLTVLKNLRASGPDLPVLILTALDRIDSRVTLLNAGADDYIAKPFDFNELEARLRAVLRRAVQKGAGKEAGGRAVRLDLATRRAITDAGSVELNSREAILLDLLLSNVEKVVSKEQIAAAWAQEGQEAGLGNSTEVHVHRLRRKLDNSNLVIKTVRGLGYLLEDRSDSAERV
jgi:two-component system OmpR family response regulator